MKAHTLGERIWGAFARAVVALRLALVLGWVAATVAAVILLPALSSSSTAPIGDIVPEHAKAIATEERALRLFGSVASTDTAIVTRDPHGLSTRETQGQLAVAAAVAQRRAPRELDGVKVAVPLVNVPVPGTHWRERGTTAISYLFLASDLNLDERSAAARAYVQQLPDPGPGVQQGITGAAPARVAQYQAISDDLPWIELATVLLILTIVALAFRSLLAPLVTLGTGAIAYLCAVRVLAWSGDWLGARPPSEIEPVLVVLLLGLVTDYTVFFLSEGRRALRDGASRLDAARQATQRVAPIVLVAGALVTAGAASLLAGKMTFFQGFGPGLALCAVVVTLVCITLVPALLALLGPRLFGRRPLRPAPAPAPSRRVVARWLTARPVAAIVGLACLAALGVGAAGARTTDLGVSFIPSLAHDAEPRQAADAAARGFVAGILGPTDVVVEQPGLGTRRAELARLQSLIAREPGVATVLGPALPLPAPAGRFLVARTGNAARFVVLLDREPTGAPAIRALRRLERRMPVLARDAGLPAGAHLAYGGDTALASESVHLLVGDLWRVGIAAALVMFVLLAVFLRALIAPLLLLVGSVLAVAGALGVTGLLLPHTVGGTEFVYYVPLVAAVLLVGLGSDYNVFLAGRIREEAKEQPLRAAIATAVPAASRAITVAGITLAATFALLAIVPLRPFRELGMLMSVGVLIDALFVRPVLIPALIAAVGPRAFWPGRRRRRADASSLGQPTGLAGAGAGPGAQHVPAP